MIRWENNMEQYKHIVQYYETDKMGITHHSNYIRWMEEARVNFLENIGFSYKTMEDNGIVSPVLAVNCDYKQTTTFGDEIYIKASVAEFKGVRLTIRYEMTKSDGTLVCEAASKHCFMGQDGRPLRLKTDYPEFYECMMELACCKD